MGKAKLLGDTSGGCVDRARCRCVVAGGVTRGMFASNWCVVVGSLARTGRGRRSDPDVGLDKCVWLDKCVCVRASSGSELTEHHDCMVGGFRMVCVAEISDSALGVVMFMAHAVVWSSSPPVVGSCKCCSESSNCVSSTWCVTSFMDKCCKECDKFAMLVYVPSRVLQTVSCKSHVSHSGS